MTNKRRKARWRTNRAAQATAVRNHCAAVFRVLDGITLTPFAFPSYDHCRPEQWTPDFDNAHLKNAAAGRLTIGDPGHRPPAPITFAPPGRRVSC